MTDNGVFYIDCSGVHDFLLTKLDDIFNELCMFVADEASGLAKEFSDELINIVEVRNVVIKTRVRLLFWCSCCLSYIFFFSNKFRTKPVITDTVTLTFAQTNSYSCCPLTQLFGEIFDECSL